MLRLQKSVHFVHFKNGNANLNVQFTLYVRTDFIISPYFDEWLISHSRATLAPLLLKVSLPHLIVILGHGPVMLSYYYRKWTEKPCMYPACTLL